MFPICLYCLTFFNTRTSSCFTGVWNGEKYKAYILKHKALILKYVPYVFYDKGKLFFRLKYRAPKKVFAVKQKQ